MGCYVKNQHMMVATRRGSIDIPILLCVMCLAALYSVICESGYCVCVGWHMRVGVCMQVITHELVRVGPRHGRADMYM
jgi:hypothetical protein